MDSGNWISLKSEGIPSPCISSNVSVCSISPLSSPQLICIIIITITKLQIILQRDQPQHPSTYSYQWVLSTQYYIILLYTVVVTTLLNKHSVLMGHTPIFKLNNTLVKFQDIKLMWVMSITWGGPMAYSWYYQLFLRPCRKEKLLYCIMKWQKNTSCWHCCNKQLISHIQTQTL